MSMSCGATSSWPRSRAKPVGVWQAATATDASTTSIAELVAAAGSMKRGYPVRCRGAVIADLPLVGQLCHREQLIFDPAEIASLDLMVSADTPRGQTPGSNPAAYRLRIPPDLLGGFSDRQHPGNCRRGCRPIQSAQRIEERPPIWPLGCRPAARAARMQAFAGHCRVPLWQAKFRTPATSIAHRRKRRKSRGLALKKGSVCRCPHARLTLASL